MDLPSALLPALMVSFLLTPALQGQSPPHQPASGFVPAASCAPGEVPAACPALLALGTETSGEGSSRWRVGAGAGFIVGGGATYAVLLSGGASTAPCNQSANQDAWSSRACLGAAALGGLVGAGLGALVGSRFRTGEGDGGRRHSLAVEPGSLGGMRMGLRLRF